MECRKGRMLFRSCFSQLVFKPPIVYVDSSELTALLDLSIHIRSTKKMKKMLEDELELNSTFTPLNSCTNCDIYGECDLPVCTK
ncbi:hypothetical protein J6590_048003 [Homalodisca vitripennis]|nr:hypothetical protein J6590_048003 [Homalodisca vitripennis]